MVAHDFFFALRCSHPTGLGAMLSEVAASLSAHVGYSAPVTAELVEELRAALSSRPDAEVAIEVHFRARGGQFEILLSKHDGALWRTARRLP